MRIIDFHMHPFGTKEEFSGMYPEEFTLSWQEGIEDLKNAGICHACGSVIESSHAFDKEKDGFAYIHHLNLRAIELSQAAVCDRGPSPVTPRAIELSQAAVCEKEKADKAQPVNEQRDRGECNMGPSPVTKCDKGPSPVTNRDRGPSPVTKCDRGPSPVTPTAKSFLTPGFHVHPAFVRESCDEIEWAHSLGYRLVGELVPYMHGWTNYGSKALSEILDTADQLHMVVSYHTVVEEAEEMDRMIAAHPGLTFVAAHPGQRPDYLRQIERLQRFPNLSLDLSGTGLFRYGMLAYGVNKVGAERFLFGTDFPICNPRMYVQAVCQEHITEMDRELIFHGNAERLLAL